MGGGGRGKGGRGQRQRRAAAHLRNWSSLSGSSWAAERPRRLHPADQVVVALARVEVLLVADDLLLHLLAADRVRVGRRLDRRRERHADLVVEGAREGVGAGELVHAAVDLDRLAHLEVGGLEEAALRLGGAVALEEDRALALALHHPRVLDLGLRDVHRVVLEVVEERERADPVVLDPALVHRLLEEEVVPQHLAVERHPRRHHRRRRRRVGVAAGVRRRRRRRLDGARHRVRLDRDAVAHVEEVGFSVRRGKGE